MSLLTDAGSTQPLFISGRWSPWCGAGLRSRVDHCPHAAALGKSATTRVRIADALATGLISALLALSVWHFLGIAGLFDSCRSRSSACTN